MRISDWSSDVCSSDLHLRDLEIPVVQGASRTRVRLCRARRLFVPLCPGPQPRKLPERFRAGDGDGVAERRSGDAHRYRKRAAARIAQRTLCRRERLPDAAGNLTLRPYFSPPYGYITDRFPLSHSPATTPTSTR